MTPACGLSSSADEDRWGAIEVTGPSLKPLHGDSPTRARLPLSRRGAQRRDILAFFPGAPVIVYVCACHPLAGSNVGNTAAGNGATVAAADLHKRGRHSRLGAGTGR